MYKVLKGDDTMAKDKSPKKEVKKQKQEKNKTK